MAVNITNVDEEPRAWSIGPLKMQLFEFHSEPSSTSATVTADKLEDIKFIVVSAGIVPTADPSISGNTATLTLTSLPFDTYGTIIAYGT